MDRTIERSTMRKVYLRLLPFAVLSYVLAYIDRINVSFAGLTMRGDLGMSAGTFGFAVGMFYWGYFIFEVPSNVILERVGARIWIARIMITWGIISSAFMFTNDIHWGVIATMFNCTDAEFTFYFLRFLLGVAEAGFFPGIILYLTYWFPSDRRAAIIALFMTGIPVAGVIGGPISGWILTAMAGVHGLAGWQWLFLLEALPSLV